MVKHHKNHPLLRLNHSRMSTAAIISVLQETLANPDLHPDSRKGMEGRLRHYRSLRRTEQDNARAIAASRASRATTARKARKEMMPHILKMKAEGMTYKAMVSVLEEKGFVSLKGTPFTPSWIGKILRDYIDQNQKGE